MRAEERKENTAIDKEGNREREGEGKSEEGRERKPLGLWGDCDHASWISISKQNKYSPSLLLLLCSSCKLVQVPCRPFPYPDLHLLASLLGSLSHLLHSPRQLSFIPLFFASFLTASLQRSCTSLSIRFFFPPPFLILSKAIALGYCICLSLCVPV